MRLLILTQKIDKDDDLLGFFHGWVTAFAKHFESIVVIALGVGEYNLPNNVKVLSLGKLEIGNWKLEIIKKFIYLINFYRYIWQERKNYDSVFVHMNQEYVILGGLLWLWLSKKIVLWRNHKAGGFWVRLAVAFSDVVFCTSQFAFVARYKKTKIMPVGVDTDFFKPDPETKKTPESILFFGRISPVKRIDLLVDALKILKKENTNFTAKIVGDAPARDRDYLASVKQTVKDYGLEDKVEFTRGVPHWQAPEIFNQNEVFINLTPAGSLDKTIFEAMACGSLVLISNKSLAGELDDSLFFKDGDAADLAKKIKDLLFLSEADKRLNAEVSRDYVVKKHSLNKLIFELAGYLGD